MPNHEPRGCPRGASYSWYLYSANRLKYPLMRKRLMKMWREAKKLHRDPVEAWASIIEDADKAKSSNRRGGRGGFVRSSWQEVNELIAASNVYTVKTYGPDRVAGFSPIPAMSMVSYASGARYLSLIGGTCLSFYDWYCDLPPASRKPGASRLTCQNPPTGTTPAILSPGALTCRKPVHRTPLLYRSTLQRHQNRRGDAGLCRNRQTVRFVAGAEAGDRCGDGAGDGSRHVARIPS
ncbi:respiratory nitrate reductase 1 subunit alpha [Salmonella enterica subsp. arizonae]|uniref:Respiratory nitrate reductase 1 subunit alpha n=1 Tax=Salmonella enterica subsp. arizonae TaxID=59203 RepID=A0A447R3G7_SALER|nr:respiratory nitrate reductase 1 subunit alpha [Salmonella enterica subsp. arizonae]